MPKHIELIARLETKLDKGELTSQGFMQIPAFLTRIGVFKYRRKDGSLVRELRHPDDVFAKESIDSLRMAPITNDHPSEFVTPENVKELAVGWISDTIDISNRQKIGATAIVADQKAIDNVNAGKVELSCGYTADLVKEAGKYDGEEYDCRQTNIRYNHVAIVERGRAGPQVRLRLDADDVLDVDLGETHKFKGASTMKFKIGDKELEMSQDVADAIAAEFKSRDDAMDKLKKGGKDMIAKCDAEVMVADAVKLVKADADKLQAKFDSLEEKFAAKKDGVAPAEVSKLVKERARIERVAKNILGAEAKIDDKADLDVIKEVLTKNSPKLDQAGKSEDYLRARFDTIADENEGREDRRQQLGSRITDTRKDEEFDAAAARKRNLDSSKADWEKPLSTSKK